MREKLFSLSGKEVEQLPLLLAYNTKSRRYVTVAQLQPALLLIQGLVHSLDLGVALQRVLALVAADAGALVATEGHGNVEAVVAAGSTAGREGR